MLVIEMVLATDMSYHFTQLKTVKNMISLNETIDKPRALSLLLHCADISHPSKHWSLHENWTNRLVEEFFAQVFNMLSFLFNIKTTLFFIFIIEK
jgi:calcium/calmodulin-dependent 3',5'-cyclic nucleotide phosphodiesterase